MKTNRIWKLALSTALVAMLISPAVFGQAAAPATAPTTAPAAKAPPLTDEQKAVIAELRKQDTPTAVFPKMDYNPVNKDGTPNDNFGKVSPSFLKQHEAFLKRKEQPIDLLFVGDSITAGWNGHGKVIWKERYAPLNAANFGIGGDRTQHVLWRIANGELDGIKPKVVVLMIGTNNISNTAEDITAGVKAVVEQIHAKLPESKLLLLGIFPRSATAMKDGKPDTARTKQQAVNAELAKLDDGNKTRYLEIWKQFLTEDGTLTKEVMPDALHPNAKGYEIWADSMQPLLDEMMK